MAISMRQVAERVGVSPGTVSRVLNGDASARVAPATRERIRRIADELGYRPNRLASSLWKGRTQTLALLISGLRNPFFVEVLETAERLALDAGYEVILDSAPSVGGTAMGHGKLSRGWPVDGALMWKDVDRQSLREFLGSTADQIPAVFLGAPEAGSDSFLFDSRQGGEAAARHLLARGRRRIAAAAPYPFDGRVLPSGQVMNDPRHEGFRDVCRRDAGIGVPLLLTHGEESREAGARLAARVAAMSADERPDAVFCHNDVLAIGLCFGLQRAGLRVPDDIAVIGFDGLEEGRYTLPPLTTVRVPVEAMCRAAVGALLRRLESPDRDAPPQTAVFPTELIVGESA